MCSLFTTDQITLERGRSLHPVGDIPACLGPLVRLSPSSRENLVVSAPGDQHRRLIMRAEFDCHAGYSGGCCRSSGTDPVGSRRYPANGAGTGREAGVRIHQLRTVWMYCQRVALVSNEIAEGVALLSAGRLARVRLRPRPLRSWSGKGPRRADHGHPRPDGLSCRLEMFSRPRHFSEMICERCSSKCDLRWAEKWLLELCQGEI